jgi:hypothetical protein
MTGPRRPSAAQLVKNAHFTYEQALATTALALAITVAWRLWTLYAAT